MKKNLLDTINGKKSQQIPIWFMRQAGRYLPEYREIRKQNKTLTMFKTPEIASEITLQPLNRFPIDGAIVYADILLIPDAMGLGLNFVEKEGPVFEKTIRSFEDLEFIKKNTSNMENFIEKLSYLGETLNKVKAKLTDNVTLLGFAGAPFTVASYMIEGKSTKGDFFETKKLMYQNPTLFHELMSILTTTSISYIKMQIKNGAQAIQLFESWSGAVDAHFYKEFCMPYVKQIVQEIKKTSPVILFLGQGSQLLDQVLEINPTVYSVDWRQDLSYVANKFNGSNIVLQGNLDPLLLFANKNLLKSKIENCLTIGRNYDHGYIFNLGHGIHQLTPIENVEYMVQLVKNF